MSEPARRHGRTVGRAAVRRTVARANPQVTRRPAARGVAEPIDTSTRPVPPPDATAPIFVDHSGRRARVLRRVAYSLVLIALALLALLWLSQASVLGAEVP
ncbi:hypothetical protein GCM10023170_011930 [Phytohabitans houttuyneae]|uniref:Uncharacterized protein n=1 Tax=Phytohabitans houttuyneae TaxID=1076126 RepID=A0A6V8KD38_9ACTN|nr:hypothetical protein Phou_037670 [Phytohabitans houttuyneae]